MEILNKENINLHKLKKLDVEHLFDSAKDACNLKNCQLYNPIMAQYMKYNNNEYSHNTFTFQTKYTITSIIKNDNQKKENKRDTYKGTISKNYSGNSDSNRQWKDNIFIKFTPLLEVYPYMKHKYRNEHQSCLPNIFHYLTTCKLNSTNNSGYIEAFCNLIVGRLTEIGKCPTFPYYYGTITGIVDNFSYDITDEYKGIKKTKWFKDNNNKLYTISNVSIDEALFDNLEEYDSDHLPHFSFDSSLESNDYSAFNTGYLKKTSLKTDVLTDTDDSIKSNSSNHISEESSSSSESEEENDFDAFNQAKKIDIVEPIDKITSESELSDIETLSDIENISNDNISDFDDLNDSDIETNDIKFEQKDTKSQTNTDDSASMKIIPGLDSEDFTMDSEYYVNIPDFPVQVICMESLDITLGEYVTKYKLCDEEWLSILFQICFGLAVVQKHYALTHNDLHGNNIMFKKTGLKYLYFCYESEYYQIPCFQKITKIIDFTRAVFQVDDRMYFSDVFRKEGDAEGQYSYPYKNNMADCIHKPNPSFDLARLGTTIAHYFKDDSQLYKLVLGWMTDKYGNNLGEEKDSFDLYIKIARGVTNAVPKEQLKNPLFNGFKIEKDTIPDTAFIYYY